MVQRADQQLLMKNLLLEMLAQCLQFHSKVQLLEGMRWIVSYALQQVSKLGEP